MAVRVRFAPSPTGYLHVGGLRTALYNYLFARHYGGKFILRIEDTDRSRLVENAQENLIKALSWAGIEFDESPVKPGEYGPYIQSERLSIYKNHSEILLTNGSAYYAFDTTEEIETMRHRQQEEKRDPKYDRMNMRNQFTLDEAEVKSLLGSGASYVVRLKVPENFNVSFQDLIRGEVVVNSNDIDDQVLMKSDGFPTYHLANVVDDHLMQITHVIRGEEWLPSTPKHVLLYNAFGWEQPQFAHLPLLLNKSKAKLSKRHGDVAVEDFIAKGYLRDAFVNFIALLGWNPSADREIYEIDELIESFNIEKVNKGGAVFDTQKLEWMNAQYLRKMPHNELAIELKKILPEFGFEKEYSVEFLEKVVKLFIERVNFLKEIPETASYMFGMPKEYEQEYINKCWKAETPSQIGPLLELYKSIDEYNHDTLYPATKEFAEGLGLKLKDIIHPIRLIITGKSAGAGMFETMEALGKDDCIARFEYFLGKYE
jgi:glutamyl-tRNA synthetase